MSTFTRKIKIIILVITGVLFSTGQALAQAEGTTTTTDTSTATSASTEAKPSKSEGYLKEIRDTLVANIDKLPIYLNAITKMALSWLAPDDSKTTATLQNQFTQLANAQIENAQTQSENQLLFLNSFNPVPKPDPSDKSDATQMLYKLKKKAADDVSYQTLMRPASPENPYQNDSIFNYTLYASGLNLKHAAPEIYWRENPSISMYKNFYNTASAVQTYNGYILSELYANSKNGDKIKQTQDKLVEQASGSQWFTEIASENVGIVLRQILLFNSQTYVLLTKLLETQQKILTAQVMNNALLIAINQVDERRLYNKASGVKEDL